MSVARAVVLAVPGPEDQPWLNIGSGPKALMPVATKPIVAHTLESLARSGVLETVLVTEPETAEAYRDVLGDGARCGLSVSYACGPPRADIRDAVRVAGETSGPQAVVIQRADAMLRDRLSDHLERFTDAGLDALALMMERRPAGDPRRRVAGSCILSPSAIAIMGNGPASPDPFARLRRRGCEIEERDVAGCLACDGDPSALLEANRLALSQLVPDIATTRAEDSELQGDVVVHPTATVRNSLVRGPAIIGPGATLVDSYVGPYTSIGARVRIEGTEIEHSIVMDDARLLYVGARLETSIIGRGAEVVRRFEVPSAVRMSLGDGAQVALS